MRNLASYWPVFLHSSWIFDSGTLIQIVSAGILSWKLDAWCYFITSDPSLVDLQGLECNKSMLQAMSCPWFYSESGSDYVAVASTVTGNSKLFWIVPLQNLDSSKGIHARTYTQSRRAEVTVKRLHLNRNWLLTGLFSSNWSVQIQPSVSLKKFGVPKYVPQCNWHGAQAHTWAVGYLWNINIHHS